MIIRVHASNGQSFMISGKRSESEDKSREGWDPVEEGKAIAYVLASKLPYPVLQEIARSTNQIVDDKSFSTEDQYFLEMKKCAEEREMD